MGSFPETCDEPLKFSTILSATLQLRERMFCLRFAKELRTNRTELYAHFIVIVVTRWKHQDDSV